MRAIGYAGIILFRGSGATAAALVKVCGLF